MRLLTSTFLKLNGSKMPGAPLRKDFTGNPEAVGQQRVDINQ